MDKKVLDDNDPPWPPERTYDWSHETSTTNLHPHLEKWHQADYEELIHVKGWPNMLPGFAKAEAARHAAQAKTTLEHPPFTLEGLYCLLCHWKQSGKLFFTFYKLYIP